MRSTRPPATASSRNSGARSASASTASDAIPRDSATACHTWECRLSSSRLSASRWASVYLSCVKRFAADLYSPRATNCASRPALSSASRRNSALVAKPTSADGARRLHPHLAERRRQVVGQCAGIGLGPRQRRLDRREGRHRVPQLLDRARRGGRNLHPRDQPGHAVVGGRTMDRGNRLPQQQRPARSVEHGERIEARGLRRHGLQIEFEDAAAGHTVMTRGIDSTEQCAHVVGAGDTRQEGEHEIEPTGGAGRAGLALCGEVFHLDPPVGLR